MMKGPFVVEVVVMAPASVFYVLGMMDKSLRCVVLAGLVFVGLPTVAATRTTSLTG